MNDELACLHAGDLVDLRMVIVYIYDELASLHVGDLVDSRMVSWLTLWAHSFQKYFQTEAYFLYLSFKLEFCC